MASNSNSSSTSNSNNSSNSASPASSPATLRRTYYEVLGITRTASEAEIKAAYHAQARKFHPDRNKGNEKEAEGRFKELHEAYSALSNAESRAAYDRTAHLRTHKLTRSEIFNVINKMMANKDSVLHQSFTFASSESQSNSGSTTPMSAAAAAAAAAAATAAGGFSGLGGMSAVAAAAAAAAAATATTSSDSIPSQLLGRKRRRTESGSATSTASSSSASASSTTASTAGFQVPLHSRHQRNHHHHHHQHQHHHHHTPSSTDDVNANTNANANSTTTTTTSSSSSSNSMRDGSPSSPSSVGSKRRSPSVSPSSSSPSLPTMAPSAGGSATSNWSFTSANNNNNNNNNTTTMAPAPPSSSSSSSSSLHSKRNSSNALDQHHQPPSSPHQTTSASSLRKGQTLQTTLSLSWEQSVRGCSKHIAFVRQALCDACKGRGSGEPVRQSCHSCSGTGYMRNLPPNMSELKISCAGCSGAGFTVRREKCKPCSASGYVAQKMQVKVVIPAGVVSGWRTCFINHGDAIAGGTYGDCIVVVNVESHPLFRRQGDDVLCDHTITFAQAALGATIVIPTIYGKAQVTIRPGHQPAEVICVRGLGFPRCPPEQVVDPSQPQRSVSRQSSDPGGLASSAGNCGVDLYREAIPSFFSSSSSSYTFGGISFEQNLGAAQAQQRTQEPSGRTATPDGNAAQTGNMLVRLLVSVPKSLTPHQQQLLQQLQASFDEQQQQQQREQE